MTQPIAMTDEVRELRARMKDFIDNVVFPAEHELERDAEQNVHEETGLPLELYAAAKARGDDASQGVRGPGTDVAARRGSGRMGELKAEAKRRGLWALGHPKSIGGGGLPFMDFVYLNEIIGRSEYGQFAVGSVSMQDSIMLDLYASPEQRERFLAPLVAGDVYPSVGLTEPEVAGSDPTLMQTAARLDGDEWVIDGHKWFTSGASRAAFTTVFAKTDPEAPKHLQFSSIIVPTDTPGYFIQRAVPTMGHVGGQHCEVVYDHVRVPRSNLLGKRGEGFIISQKRLGPGRIFHCMRWLGQAQRAFELMCERALTRHAHGSLLAEKGAIHTMIAESAAEIQAARLMTLDAARVMDSGSEARVEISLIKFHGAKMLHNVIDRAIQVHGALGVTSDRPLDRMYREARYGRLYDGPDEVHHMVVARNLLKGYKDRAPWS
jgi:alkylation response protein AidB-like acyl-CoA dehydrogenase